jgi:beta-barrel assembly-enhancing protease
MVLRIITFMIVRYKINKKIERIFVIVFLVMLVINLSVLASDRDYKKEEKIGQKIATRIKNQYDLIEDEEILEKLYRISEDLKEISGIEQINYQFNIIDREGPNAFALPGGFIYLTADLFDHVHSDDELAAIIAHEMGHIIHQHSIKQMQDNRKMKLVELFAVLLTGDETIGLLGELTTITVLNNYRREYEAEADLTALELLKKSTNYHPIALLTYFERVGSEQLLKPGQNLGIFQTHPDIEVRLKNVKQYLIENGIEINRRLTTNYITVRGECNRTDNDEMIAQIFLNNEEILKFTGREEELLCEKMEGVKSKLDKNLRLNLETYEIAIHSAEEQSNLRIGSEKIISLTQEEVASQDQNLTPTEVLKNTKEKIARIYWHLKLELPILLVKE